jgi:hypothetical protein
VECPEDLARLLDYLQLTKLEDGHKTFIEVASYNYKVSSLTSRIRQLTNNEDPKGSIPLALNFLAEASNFDADFQKLTKSQSGNESTNSEENGLIYLYALNSYRAARCKMYHFLGILLHYVAPYAWPYCDKAYLRKWHNDCRVIIQEMSNDILNSITLEPSNRTESIHAPKIPCWADALRLIWPLTVVTRLSDALPEQRSLAHDSLRLIGRGWGIKQAWIEGTSAKQLSNVSKYGGRRCLLGLLPANGSK